MSILFGHPTGNPNSHHAALAHFETGRLQAFCIPWLPTIKQIRWARTIPQLGALVERLERRCFDPLSNAPRIEGKPGEWWRMLRRMFRPLQANERLSYEANDWLMRTMARECRRPAVTAVHSYEDCSLWQFQEAKRLGKACIYDMPIGYYPAWQSTQAELAHRYADWLPPGGLSSNQSVRPGQKQKEMELADLVFGPSTFVLESVRLFHSQKRLVLAPYGVDLEYWRPGPVYKNDGPLRFLYAGQISIRKGIPVLLEAWRKADLKDAQLRLVGLWKLSEKQQRALPSGVTVAGPCSRESLRAHYQAADVFVFPSFFEGLPLCVLEAMACALPVITTEVTAGMDLTSDANSQSIPAGNVESLTEALRWFDKNRDRLPEMRHASRAKAAGFTWERYRATVREAVAPFAGES